MSYPLDLRLLITLLIVLSFTGMSQTNEPPKKGPAELMRELRLKMLTTRPAELGQEPTQEYPHIYGILMDWPIETGIVSVVSLSSGDASLYTTGTFGVIGGIGHETVRVSAAVLRSKRSARGGRAQPEQKPPLSGRGENGVSPRVLDVKRSRLLGPIWNYLVCSTPPASPVFYSPCHYIHIR